MKYERTVRGLTVDENVHGWRVTHADSGLEAVSGLRQRRSAEQARDELLATGVDFTASSQEIQTRRKEWSEIYFRWQARVSQVCFDDTTFEYYSRSCSYGTFIPSASWAAAMRHAIADHNPDEITRLLAEGNKAVSQSR